MIRRLVIICALVTLFVDGHAQRSYNVFHKASVSNKVESVQSTAVMVNPVVIRALVSEKHPRVSIDIPMPQGANLVLILDRWSIVDQASRLTVMTDDGPVHYSLGSGLVWYRATLPNGGMAVLTFSAAGGMSGLIDVSEGRYLIGRQTSSSDPKFYVVMRDYDAPYTCATPVDRLSKELHRLIGEASEAVKSAGERTQAGDTVTIELAIEADFMLVQEFGSKELATLYIGELVAALSNVYERELGVRFILTNLRIWDTPMDPYDDEASIFQLFFDFIDLYRSTMTTVRRDLAVFITSRGGQGGIARTIGGICQEDGSYCAGDVLRKIKAYPTWSWDVGMLAHEVGHVCGGIHTHSCYWPNGPLDSCVASESGSCVTTEEARPTRGTIMSYCHQQIPNGAVMTMEFHPLHRNVLRSYIRSTACLGNESRPRISRLEGVTMDAITGKPLSGVRITIVPVNDEIYRQTLPPIGDSVVTTTADGSYAFQGLGSGLYQLVITPPFVAYPVSLSEQSRYNAVMIADSVVHHDLKVVKGRIVDLTITNDGDTTPVTLNIYSDQLPNLLDAVQLPIDEAGLGSIKVSQAVPVGRYIVVPTASGRAFTPNKVVVDLVASDDPMSVSFASSSTLPLLTSSVGLGVFEYNPTSTQAKYKLSGGMPYSLTNFYTDKVISEGMIPDDGVVVVNNVAIDTLYSFDTQIDTNDYAPLIDYVVVYPNYFTCGTYIQQWRRKPLIVREYSMSVLNTPYVSLVDPIILRNKAMAFNRPIRVDLPFPLRIGDRDMQTMHVARNGYVTFGYTALPTWVRYPIGQMDEAMMIVAPFAAELHPDTTATNAWHIAWKSEGVSPDRVVIIEWRNLTLRMYNWNTGQAKDVGRFSFQAHIHERGQIDMVYDAAENVVEQIIAVIGLRGNDILDNQLLTARSANNLTDVNAIYIPNASAFVSLLTSDGMKKGLTYRWELAATLVDEDELTKLAVTPVPASSEVLISGLNEAADVRIIDALGSVVASAKLEKGNTHLYIGSIAAGRYTLVVSQSGTLSALPMLIIR